MKFIPMLLINAVAVYAATIIDGVKVQSFFSALWVAIILAVLNTFLKPVLEFVSIPVTLLTLGLFLLAINAFILYLAQFLSSGFKVEGFWPAFWGSIIISVVSYILTSIFLD